MYHDDELLALSGLQHLAYCERQWGLIHLEQIWADSSDTLRGNYFHERVDTIGYISAKNVRAERSVRLVSHSLGIYGIADIVEYGVGDTNPFIRPVEYKVGKPKIEDWDRLQLVAQSLCLEEMYDVIIPEGHLFYGETRRQEHVEITTVLRDKVTTLAMRMHELIAMGTTPQIGKNPKCYRCSLADECLPAVCNLDGHNYWLQNGESWG